MKLYQQHVLKNWRDLLDPECTVVIDGDYVAFTVASGIERRTIRAIHKKSGRSMDFKTRTDFWGRNKNNVPSSGSWLSDRNVQQLAKGSTEFVKTDFEVEDVQTTIASDEQIKKNIHAMVDRIKGHLGVKNVLLLVGRGECFRHKLLLANRYKDNRNDTKVLRPLKLSLCKEYIIENMNSELVQGIEADDRCSHYLQKGADNFKKTGKISHIVSVIDKDNYQTSGFLFQPVKDPTHQSSAFDDFDTGLYFTYPAVFKIPNWEDSVGTVEFKKDLCKPMGLLLLTQHLLLGDYATDHFSPLKTLSKEDMPKKPRYGEKTCYKDLIECQTAADCFNLVKRKYTEWFGDRIKYTDWEGNVQDLAWHEYLELIFKCAYMQRWENDTTTIYDLFKEYGIRWEEE